MLHALLTSGDCAFALFLWNVTISPTSISLCTCSPSSANSTYLAVTSFSVNDIFTAFSPDMNGVWSTLSFRVTSTPRPAFLLTLSGPVMPPFSLSRGLFALSPASPKRRCTSKTSYQDHKPSTSKTTSNVALARGILWYPLSVIESPSVDRSYTGVRCCEWGRRRFGIIT